MVENDIVCRCRCCLDVVEGCLCELSAAQLGLAEAQKKLLFYEPLLNGMLEIGPGRGTRRHRKKRQLYWKVAVNMTKEKKRKTLDEALDDAHRDARVFNSAAFSGMSQAFIKLPIPGINRCDLPLFIGENIPSSASEMDDPPRNDSSDEDSEESAEEREAQAGSVVNDPAHP